MKNLNESLPIYVRIEQGIKESILSGQLHEEDKIPSTTYLSNTYKINITTVNKAINHLVDEGLVYKKRGIGMFVKTGALKQLIKEGRETFKNYYVKATIIEGIRLQYTDQELLNIFKEVYSEVKNNEIQK